MGKPIREWGDTERDTNPGALAATSLAQGVHVEPGQLSAADWTEPQRLTTVTVARGLPYAPGVQGRHERIRVKFREGKVEYHVIPRRLEKGRTATRISMAGRDRRKKEF